MCVSPIYVSWVSQFQQSAWRPLLPHWVAERREEVLLLLLELLLLLLLLLVPVVVVERGREALEVLERRRGRPAAEAAHGRQRG